jgi:hypothetical protein
VLLRRWRCKDGIFQIGFLSQRTLGHGLSNNVKEFIAKHVHSVLQLEVLLLLSQNRDNIWSAHAVSRELNLSVKSAKVALVEIVSDGLLVVADGEDLYRYNPSSEELDEIVRQLATAYTTQRVGVLSLIFAKPVDKVRLFTETFRMITGDER